MKLLIFLLAAALISGCKPKQTVTVTGVTLEGITTDTIPKPPPPPPPLPPPPEPGSVYASFHDWLEAMSMRKPPHDSIIILHFQLHEQKGSFAISVFGSAQYDIFDHSWLQHPDYVPANGFYVFKAGDIQGGTRQELQAAAEKIILSFLDSKPTAPFFSRVKGITIGWEKEGPVRLR